MNLDPMPAPWRDNVHPISDKLSALWTGSFHGFGIFYSSMFGKAVQWGGWLCFDPNGLKQTGLKSDLFFGVAWKSDFGPCIGTGRSIWHFGGRYRLDLYRE